MNGIVVGVDGSDQSRDALAWAVEEGRLRKAPVHAIHGWEIPVIPTTVGLIPPRPDLAVDSTGLAESAQRLAETMVKEVLGGAEDVEVEAIAIEGQPAQVLVEAADGAQMVVVGTRGHGSFAALLLGSVSEQVVRHAPCPVVVHRNTRAD